MSVAPTSSTDTTREGACAANFCATTASTGSTISRSSDFALARMSRAVGTRSFSHSDLPTALPCAARKVLAMPPPMISVSTCARRLPSRSSLVETLAPPTMAATGRCGASQRLLQRLELGLHGAAGIGGQEVRERFGRSVRAVRGGKRVVDIDVAELRERGREGRIVLFLALVEARVLQAENVARLHARDRLFGDLADAIVGKGDRPADDARDRGSDRLERIPSDRGPSAGRNARAGSPCRLCRRSR